MIIMIIPVAPALMSMPRNLARFLRPAACPRGVATPPFSFYVSYFLFLYFYFIFIFEQQQQQQQQQQPAACPRGVATPPFAFFVSYS